MAVKIPAVVITAKDATARAFGSVNKGLKKIGRAAGAITKGVAGAAAAGAAAGVAAMGALVASSLKSVDQLAKVSDKLGTTTEALSALQYAGELTGVKTETMNMALQRLTRRVSEASAGTGEAKDAIAELGLNAEVLDKMPLDEKMATLADAFEKVPTQADRVRLSFKLFDSEGVALVSTLMKGREGLSEFAREADHLGLSVSRVDAAQIENANDAVTRAKSVFTGVGNQLATSFSPLIQGVADAFRQSALDTEDFGSIGQRVVDALVKALGFLGDVVLGMQITWMELKISFFQIINAIKVKWQEFMDLLPDLGFLDGVTEGVGKAFDWMGDRIQDGINAITGSMENATETGKTLSDGIGIATAETEAMTAELQALYARMGTNPPSEGIHNWFTDLQETSRRTAEIVAANAPGKVILDDLDAAGKVIVDKMSFIEKMTKQGAKKTTEFLALTHTERAQTAVSTMSGMFSETKALSIAQALINTYAAATLALKSFPPPLSYAMAAATVAAGLQQVGKIKATSYEGGGYTGSGPRNQGIDSKGGFLGVLHPGEVVTDLKKNGSGVTIINQIDASGADPGVEIRIKQAMLEASAQTASNIQNLMRRRRFV